MQELISGKYNNIQGQTWSFYLLVNLSQNFYDQYFGTEGVAYFFLLYLYSILRDILSPFLTTFQHSAEYEELIQILYSFFPRCQSNAVFLQFVYMACQDKEAFHLRIPICLARGPVWLGVQHGQHKQHEGSTSSTFNITFVWFVLQTSTKQPILLHAHNIPYIGL